MEKNRSKYLLARINKLLYENNAELVIRLAKIHHLQHARGLSWYTLGIIHVDPRKELLPTTIHEALHMIYPLWSETKIAKAERGICHKMSERQFANLLVRLADYLVRVGFANRRSSNGNERRQPVSPDSRRNN